jgi:hypothetical protein
MGAVADSNMYLVCKVPKSDPVGRKLNCLWLVLVCRELEVQVIEENRLSRIMVY